MISSPMNSKFLGNIIFTKEEALSLSKIRIIKKNLVHVHGFPPSLANTEKLNKLEYFGQYGKILKTLLTHKINPDTNKKSYSVYITYSNEKEASFAILSVDSLLIEGKIIRAFFGTTKYCNYFLNNSPCPNFDKCMFLHQLIKDKDIIIDSNTIFSYNEHLDLAKKIIQFSNPKTKLLVQKMPKLPKTFFPNVEFIFLNEIEKENYLKTSDISYIKSNFNKCNQDNFIPLHTKPQIIKNELQNNIINNFVNININNGYIIKNNSRSNLKEKYIINNNINNLLYSPKCIEKKTENNNSNDPLYLYKILKNPIKHILSVKPLFINLKNIPLKEIELDYFKKELEKTGNNFYTLFDGCLDCINNEE